MNNLKRNIFLLFFMAIVIHACDKEKNALEPEYATSENEIVQQ